MWEQNIFEIYKKEAVSAARKFPKVHMKVAKAALYNWNLASKLKVECRESKYEQ